MATVVSASVKMNVERQWAIIPSSVRGNELSELNGLIQQSLHQRKGTISQSERIPIIYRRGEVSRAAVELGWPIKQQQFNCCFFKKLKIDGQSFTLFINEFDSPTLHSFLFQRWNIWAYFDYRGKTLTFLVYLLFNVL